VLISLEPDPCGEDEAAGDPGTDLTDCTNWAAAGKFIPSDFWVYLTKSKRTIINLGISVRKHLRIAEIGVRFWKTGNEKRAL
jgi:hypothetical protein